MFFPWWVKKKRSYGLEKPMGSHEDRSQPGTFYLPPEFYILIHHPKIFQKVDSRQSLVSPTLFHPTLLALKHRYFVPSPGLCLPRVTTAHLTRRNSVLHLDQVLSLLHWAAVQITQPPVSRTASFRTRAGYTITWIRHTSALVWKPVFSQVSSLM